MRIYAKEIVGAAFARETVALIADGKAQGVYPPGLGDGYPHSLTFTPLLVGRVTLPMVIGVVLSSIDFSEIGLASQ